MLKELFEKFDGAFAPNTIRAYRADFTHFSDWCNVHGVNPLVSTAKDWEYYLTYCSEHLTTATVRRRLDSLSTIFTLAQLENHSHHPDVILMMKRMHRARGRAQKQAEPLTRDILEKLKAVCSPDIPGHRNRVLLQLGYETMRRRSELCNFRFEDVQVLPNGKLAIFMAKSKTDQFGQGKLLPISEELYELLICWKDITGDGFILRGFKRNLELTQRLGPPSINVILKDLEDKAALNLKQSLSGHSFRVGRALDLLMDGEPLEKIMIRGGWKSESTTLRYLRSWQDL